MIFTHTFRSVGLVSCPLSRNITKVLCLTQSYGSEVLLQKCVHSIAALSHYHASKSIKSKDAVDGKADEHKENSFVFDESSLNGDVCPNVLRMAHIKESLACHEEAQRLQRMCRDLKVFS